MRGAPPVPHASVGPAAADGRVPEPVYGRRLIASLPRGLLERPAVISQPEPWERVRGEFREDRTQLHFVRGMEHEAAARIAAGFEPASAVFGIGGGSALDLAKFVAWKRGFPLVQVPSILSADAAFTRAIAVREGAQVRYVGSVLPEVLLVDFSLIGSAPRALNLSGAGDVLSIFTALWDWREAHERLGEAYDPGIAAASRAVLARLLAGVREVRDLAEGGLHLLSESYRQEVLLCERFGNARPEEGSEHAVAYALEQRTGRQFLHGRLVCLCTLLAGRFQGQDVAPVRSFLEEVGLDVGPEAAGTSRAELREVLTGMGAYAREETHLLPGVFHFRGGVPEAEVDELLSTVDRWCAVCEVR